MEHKTKYDLYCDFDIKKHKETFINYLEVIIDSDGVVHYAVPSHQEYMIEQACLKFKVDRCGLDAMCPKEYYFDYMTWLSKVTGCVAVWNDFVRGYSFNKKQKLRLKELKLNGLYRGTMPNDNVVGGLL